MKNNIIISKVSGSEINISKDKSKLIVPDTFDIKEVGLGLKMSGMFMTSRDNAFVVAFPEEWDADKFDLELVIPSKEEWASIVEQMSIQEVEIIEPNSKAKMIVRKSQRQLEQNIVWEVFRRDFFTCRYCGNNKAPMTYDHILLWEKGGNSTIQNGITSCKKCNKTRGNMEFDEWLESDYYKEISKNLSGSEKASNIVISKIYKKFPLRTSKRTRK